MLIKINLTTGLILYLMNYFILVNCFNFNVVGVINESNYDVSIVILNDTPYLIHIDNNTLIWIDNYKVSSDSLFIITNNIVSNTGIIIDDGVVIGYSFVFNGIINGGGFTLINLEINSNVYLLIDSNSFLEFNNSTKFSKDFDLYDKTRYNHPHNYS